MEQSGQQVFSDFMDFGDWFCSHTYVPLFLSSLIGELCRMFPTIKKKQLVFELVFRCYR
jgi:hypothetical protein